MARRPNYGFEKRQKEIQKKAKQEEKAERKRLRRESGLGTDEFETDGEAPDGEPGGGEADDDA
jgi:hypothetical protein